MNQGAVEDQEAVKDQDAVKKASAEPVKESLHLCIATGQNIPNLIGAIQSQATRVWILETSAMREGATNLERALKSRRIETRRIPFDDSDPAQLEQAAEQVAMQVDETRLPVTINVTGGTKLMTIALTQTLVEHLKTGETEDQPLRVIYVNTAARRIEVLATTASAAPMQDLLTLPDCWAVQGYTEIASGKAEDKAYEQRDAHDRRDLVRLMMDRSSNLESWLPMLNGAANGALSRDGRTLEQPEQTFSKVPFGAFADLLTKAAELGLVQWDRNGRSMTFCSADAARYLGGGWAEHFAADEARSSVRLAGGQTRMNVTLEQIGNRVRNEIDVALLRSNRLLVIECKTARGTDDKASAWIYKVRNLADHIGGSMAGAMIVSATRLPDESHERALRDGVVLIDEPRIRELRDWLRDWPDGPLWKSREQQRRGQRESRG